MAGRRRALIVAGGEYDNAGLQRLGSPAADADALAGVLSDRAISDFDVRVVRNETAHVVQAEVEDLCAEGRPDDVLLLHFSCHGLKDDTGQLFFAARNTRPDRLRSTAVPAHFVQQCLRQSRSRSVVLLLDCCYGGAFGQGVAVRASGDANVLDSFRGGRGRAVITASNSIEYAFEGARLAEGGVAQPSVFTSALVEGLRTGEADRDEDGWIALGELYEYLFDRVRERNPKQTPSRDIEMQGELYLARSRRRRIKPSPIPADLAAAIEAENPFTRLGAVAELRRRLTSANLEVAVGAFEALKVMSSTDVQHVAEAAGEALGRAAVRIDPAEVRLSAAPGSVVAEELRPAGPPVAREVRFEASHAWISVVETATGAELSVTAGETGVRRGRVVVTGPTGETVVAVAIEAVPEPEVVPEAEVAEPAPGPAARPESRVVPEPEVAAEPRSRTVAGPVAEPNANAAAPEPLAEPAPGVVAEPGARVVAEPASRVVAGPMVEPEPVADVVAEPDAAVEAEREPEVVGDLAPGMGARAAAGPESRVVAETALGPAAEPGVKPNPVAGSGSAVAPGAEPLVADPGSLAAGERTAAGAEPSPEAAPESEPAAREAAAVDPAGWFAVVTAFVGVALVVIGMLLEYRHGYLLGQYRPGMQQVVAIVAACALLGAVLTLVPRTRARTGPAVLLGAALAASFGLARFIGEATTLSQHGEDTDLAAGYTFELLGHIALVAMALGALTVLRRNPAGALRAAKIEGWTAWVGIVLGVTVGGGWLGQLAELTEYDTSDGGRAAAYFVLGALLAVAVPGVAAILRPAAVGRAVLAVGIAGLVGVMVPTSDAVQEHSSLTQVGQGIAMTALVLLAIVAVVQAVQARRNQPNGRQS
ncbi:caspase family protein [Amycolatopsis sp., V23-08]|uniref:Caspase family protein n=1 Tax=Amycolatopsis heterodermiae TaxID=3110235 RepID=A0ABU5REC1_9PSEU|nr:caspase family protein [Amycolatopsis sp., V23-08]MEA5364064.1 caspase family protein [Amycolatopsis sp., V23-08]